MEPCCGPAPSQSSFYLTVFCANVHFFCLGSCKDAVKGGDDCTVSRRGVPRICFPISVSTCRARVALSWTYAGRDSHGPQMSFSHKETSAMPRANGTEIQKNTQQTHRTCPTCNLPPEGMLMDQRPHRITMSLCFCLAEIANRKVLHLYEAFPSLFLGEQ